MRKVYEKEVTVNTDKERHLFLSETGVPVEGDTQLSCEDAEGTAVTVDLLKDKFVDAGNGLVKVIQMNDGGKVEKIIKTFAGTVCVIPYGGEDKQQGPEEA